jgi:hypothetical protein
MSRWSDQAIAGIEKLRATGHVVDHHRPQLAVGVTEKEFQAAVMRLAKRHNWLAWHCVIARKSEAGFPDLVLVRGGRVIFAELKTDSGQLDAPQETWREALAAVGGNVSYYLWRPADWSSIETVLAAVL